ncbi:hypothetical protein Bca52824_029193 [Brassica carinata]|uniref:Uncharacterized protein n=1 Tax=Brassica carinata TaxID=52824 RepID=A0A8X8APD9_BRACI|nr:hypothetical protein Bca52824_029193 [Brassica carinata]
MGLKSEIPKTLSSAFSESSRLLTVQKESNPTTKSNGERPRDEWLDRSLSILRRSFSSKPLLPLSFLLFRNLDQLEALSKKLKAKTLRNEAPSQSIAATRLLAREGINAEQLARDLKSFELKTTFEDVFPLRLR